MDYNTHETPDEAEVIPKVDLPIDSSIVQAAENVVPPEIALVESETSVEGMLDDAADTGKAQAEIDETNVNFSQNRELWQRRANLENVPISPLLKTHRLSEPYMQRQNHTPDLVMDLPLIGNQSPKEQNQITKSMSVIGTMYPDSSPEEEPSSTKPADNSSGADSPDMQTAAETFAKQNQCTLKKNKKVYSHESPEYVMITSPMPDRKYATLGSSTSPSTTTFKPQPKAKPMVLKKPVFSVPLRSVSIEMMCKDPPDLPT